VKVEIMGSGTDGVTAGYVTSVWKYSSTDPLAVTVDFVEAEVSWSLSLDLLREALGSFSGEISGSGDFLVDVVGDVLFLHLSNGVESVVLEFPVVEVQAFVSQVNDQDANEIVARELDKFLEGVGVD
jgi:hypothetical protein